MKVFACIAVTGFLAVGGCASVDVRKVDSAYTGSGLHFYRPSPYLLVSPGESGKPEVKIIQLPDRSEEYVVDTKSGIGTTDYTAALTDGWNLTSLNGKEDSKVPETLTALASLIPAVSALGTTKPSGSPPQQTTLYKLNWNATTGWSVGPAITIP